MWVVDVPEPVTFATPNPCRPLASPTPSYAKVAFMEARPTACQASLFMVREEICRSGHVSDGHELKISLITSVVVKSVGEISGRHDFCAVRAVPHRTISSDQPRHTPGKSVHTWIYALHHHL